MAIAAKDGADRADQLIAITQRLQSLILEETNALKQGKLDASTRDWQEKEKLAHAYRLEIQAIRSNPAMLDGASPQQKSELRDEVERFRALTEAHAHALEAGKEVTEGLFRAISEEIAETRAAPKGYGSAGGVTKPKDESSKGIAANFKA